MLVEPLQAPLVLTQEPMGKGLLLLVHRHMPQGLDRSPLVQVLQLSLLVVLVQ